MVLTLSPLQLQYISSILMERASAQHVLLLCASNSDGPFLAHADGMRFGSGPILAWQLLRDCCAWAQRLASYWDTETLEATGTPAAGQSSSDGDLWAWGYTSTPTGNNRRLQQFILAKTCVSSRIRIGYMHLDSIDKPDTDQKSTVIIRWGPSEPEVTQGSLLAKTCDNRRVRTLSHVLGSSMDSIDKNHTQIKRKCYRDYWGHRQNL